jgi:hypothetical protein
MGRLAVRRERYGGEPAPLADAGSEPAGDGDGDRCIADAAAATTTTRCLAARPAQRAHAGNPASGRPWKPRQRQAVETAPAASRGNRASDKPWKPRQRQARGNRATDKPVETALAASPGRSRQRQVPTHATRPIHGVDGPRLKYVRRRPTLPHSLPCSTIGAERLSFRVRNGAGRFPFAMVAVTLWRCVDRPVTAWPKPGAGSGPTVSREPHSGRVYRPARSRSAAVCGQALGLLVPVSCTDCSASTSGLSTRWSSRGPYQVDPVRDLILKRASRLDAFSGYPCRT